MACTELAISFDWPWSLFRTCATGYSVSLRCEGTFGVGRCQLSAVFWGVCCRTHLAGLVVEALLRGVEADLLDGLANDGLVVDLGVGGDLTEHHDEVGAGAGLAGDVRVRVLGEAGIDDSVGDLRAKSTHPTASANGSAGVRSRSPVRPERRSRGAHLVGQLVRVALVDGLGREEKLGFRVKGHLELRRWEKVGS